MSESSGSGGGIGFVGLLTIAFITLKLTGYIHWSWIWILSPIWISVAVWTLILVFIAIVEIRDDRKRAAKRRSS